VVLQKSIREGFGLTVTEALWKGRPVIGGDCGGIRAQIQDNENGFLVGDIETCAQRILYLLNSPDEAQRLGANGRETVRRNFLMPRLLADYLSLFEEMLALPHSQRGDGAEVSRLCANEPEPLRARPSHPAGMEVTPR
jgi:trehalose synthase